jgi:hypothetical protein
MAVSQRLATIAQQRLPPHVERAIETLGRVLSLHVRATITLSSEQTRDQPVAGVYEYWEKDGKYRVHFGIDLAEIPVSDIAYNGRQYQLGIGPYLDPFCIQYRRPSYSFRDPRSLLPSSSASQRYDSRLSGLLSPP